MSSVTIDREEFCRACGKYATGITIATVVGSDGAPHGMTANSFTSVSLTPPLILVCVDHRSKILDHFRKTQYFGINVLSEAQQSLSAHFARSGHDRFYGIDWWAGETGVPLLPGVLAYFECALNRTVDAGDHAILIGQAIHASSREGRPLIYFSSRYQTLGSPD